MGSRPPSYHEAFDRTKNLTLNTSRLEEDIFRTSSSSSISRTATNDKRKRTSLNHTLSGAPVPAINAVLKRELDQIKKQLKTQRQHVWLSFAVAVFTIITMIVAIAILDYYS